MKKNKMMKGPTARIIVEKILEDWASSEDPKNIHMGHLLFTIWSNILSSIDLIWTKYCRPFLGLNLGKVVNFLAYILAK